MKQFWARHRQLFWMLHSAWALGSGATIAFFSHERYELVGWVALFLALTWASTLYFGRRGGLNNRESPSARSDAVGPGQVEASTTSSADATPVLTADPVVGGAPSIAHEVTSYLTRVMYQETLFFLLPFYAYSTEVRTPNVTFTAALAALAFFSCIDIPFDRWLRTKPVFGFAFFALVAFAATNLLLPLSLGLRVRMATPAAAVLSIAVAIPLAWRSLSQGAGARLRLLAAAATLLVVAVAVPVLVPPTPLRLREATFASGIEREGLVLADSLPASMPASRMPNRLVLLVYVFAPSDLQATVHLVWKRDGEVLRTSRDLEIVAHQRGFRVWDAWPVPEGSKVAGDYRVEVQTANGRIIGVAKLAVHADG